MPLRKPPRRTPALLAANRDNCRKSTGPRTPSGKLRSSWNSVRHGSRMQLGAYCVPFATREAEGFQMFYFTLRDAIQPTSGTVAEERALLRTAVRAWRIKCLFERLTRSLSDEDWLAVASGAVTPPSSWRLRIKRPGFSVLDWTVTISVWLRWGRGPGQGGGQDRGQSRPLATGNGPQRHGRRMHPVLSVHSTGPRCCSENGPLGCPGLAPPALSAAEGVQADPRACPERSEEVGPPGKLDPGRTKPECNTIESGYENMPVLGDRDLAFGAIYSLAQGLLRSLMGGSKRTKPEYDRKQSGCENMSAWNDGNIAPAALDGTGSPGLPEVSTGAKQPKTEYRRKEGAYKNVSKTLAWLGAAVSSLMKRAASRQPIELPRVTK